MKKKELENLAKRIAEQEKIIQTSSDKKVINEAKSKVVMLTNKAIGLDANDLWALDDMIQKLLKQEE